MISLTTNKTINYIPYKEETLTFTIADIIYQKLFERATKDSPVNRRITFADASFIIGGIYRLPKEIHFKIFKLLEKQGYVEIRPYSFLELKKEVVEK